MSGLPRSPHALVTGGSRGIGRAIAAQLAGAGLTVTVLGRQQAALDEAGGRRRGALRRDSRCRRPGRYWGGNRQGRSKAAYRHPDRQCRHRGIRSLRQVQCRAVQPDDGRQFHGRRLFDPGRAAVDEGPSLRTHRRGSVDCGPEGLCLCQRLQRRQTCGDRAGALACTRAGQYPDHGQRGMSRLHRHRSRRWQHRQHHEKDRSQP